MLKMQFLAACRSAFQSKNWQGLVKMLGHIDIQLCDQPELLIFLGVAHDELGQPELGIPALAKALELNAESLELKLRVVHSLMNAGDWCLALELLEGDSRDEFWSLSSAQISFWRCKSNLGNPAAAERNLALLQGKDGVDRVELGFALLEANILLKNEVLAKEIYRQMRRFVPNDPLLDLLEIDLLLLCEPGEFKKMLCNKLDSGLPNNRRLCLKILRHLRWENQLMLATQVASEAIRKFGFSGALAELYLYLLAEVGDLQRLTKALSDEPLIIPPIDTSIFIGLCLFSSGKYEESEKAFSGKEDQEFALHYLSEIAKIKKQPDEVLRLRRQALDINNSPGNKLNLGLELLGMFQWEEGWDLYRARLELPQEDLKTGFSLKEFNASSTLAGKKVLIFEEQGIGDMVMMASILEDVIFEAKRVDCLVSGRLSGVLAESFLSLNVYTRVEELPDDYDVAYAFCSLAGIYRRSSKSFPAKPYLFPSNDLVNSWSGRLIERTDGCLSSDLRVGLAWSGGLAGMRSARSIPLEELAPILKTSGVQWVSLQHNPDMDELVNFKRNHQIDIHLFEGSTYDIHDLSALIKSLDLVITVQQTVLHIAGAVGTPAWVMLPAIPEWRYGFEGSKMHWYESVELHRQVTPGHWGDLIFELASKLSDAVMARLSLSESIHK